RHTISDRDWSSDVCSSDLLSSLSSRNTQVSVGPGSTTSLIFLYIRNPDGPKLAASAPSNQAFMEILRTRGVDCPLKGPEVGLTRSEERRVGDGWSGGCE